MILVSFSTSWLSAIIFQDEMFCPEANLLPLNQAIDTARSEAIPSQICWSAMLPKGKVFVQPVRSHFGQDHK